MYLAAAQRSFHGFLCFIRQEQGVTRSDQSAKTESDHDESGMREVGAYGRVSSVKFGRSSLLRAQAYTTTRVECHQN
jgi:hypothetical protein